jgi:Spy/CpxP family protein refolding chaperone
MVKRLLFSGLLAAALCFAQGGMGGGGMGGGGGDMGSPRGGGEMGGGGMGGGGGMPRTAPTPMERMSTFLTLNKDQKKQFKSIMDDSQKEALAVRDQMLKGRQTIAEAVAAGKTQDEIGAAIKDYSAAQVHMTQIEIHAFAKIFQTLDKEQQAKAPGLLGMMNGIFKGKNWDASPTSPN